MIQPFFQANATNAIVQGALEGCTARHHAIVNNIANVDTPGYQRKAVSFEESLKRAIRDIEPKRGIAFVKDKGQGAEVLPRFSISVSADDHLSIRADGSNVSIDREMADLARNTAQISALTELLNRNYGRLQAAIRGRNA